MPDIWLTGLASVSRPWAVVASPNIVSDQTGWLRRGTIGVSRRRRRSDG